MGEVFLAPHTAPLPGLFDDPPPPQSGLQAQPGAFTSKEGIDHAALTNHHAGKAHGQTFAGYAVPGRLQVAPTLLRPPKTKPPSRGMLHRPAGELKTAKKLKKSLIQLLA